MPYELRATIKAKDGTIHNTITVPYIATKKQADSFVRNQIVDAVIAQRKISGNQNLQATVTVKKR
jgi:hypothetical protein